MSTVIGIDLGTTNSLCAVFRGGAPELVPNACGELLTPSVVGVLADGQVIVGAAAKELAIARPETCVSGFKRWMGTEREIELGGETLSPAGLSSLILASLKADAEAFLGEAVSEAVITVPAYFNEHQREATKLAGELAGLRVRRILNEPTAAALTYGFHDRDADKTLLVFDLGGGTFDVTLMEIFEGTLEILATAGESHLGGEDFTDKLVDWALKERGMLFEPVEFHEPRRLSRLREEAERAKRTLGDADSATLRFPESDGTIGEDGDCVRMPASLFAELAEGLMARLEPPIQKALRDGRHMAGQVDEVILVGGATRMPIVRQRVTNVFDTIPLSTQDPDHVVALGAAVQAALIADDRSVEDMVLTDVCPFTLGLEVTKEFGKQLEGGYYMPVIHRNTTIPVSKEEFVATLVEDQPEIILRVYQGDARRIKDNLYLGELAVKGIPKGPAGTPVAVRFTYDLSGLLEVEAYVPSTNEKFQTILTHHVKGLTEEEIERAAANIARLKFYPRDELANRRLVLYSERILGEIGPYEREGLDHVIDVFEESMQSGDADFFESARRELLIRLSGLGFEFDESDESRVDDG